MHESIQLTNIIPSLRKSLSRTPLWRGVLLIPLALAVAWFALSPAPKAFGVSPAPDGGYSRNNTAEGTFALNSLTSGVNNTANGFEALFNNTTGGANTATGFEALFSNTTASFNTASGFQALVFNTTGVDNTAVGVDALFTNTTGRDNIALGFKAGGNLTTGNNNIDIFDPGLAGEANTIRIGTEATQTATFIAGIFGATASGGVAVFVNSSGKLGTVTSSARFKQDIHSMDGASEAVLALQPVTFRYKQEIDPKGIPQFGLVAEQVEKVNPDLVARDAEGKAYSVRYEAVNAMLLNEFLKEHRKVQQLESKAQEQEREAQKQEAMIAHQQKQIEALTAAVEKVSDQMELSKPPSQTVANNR